MVCSNKVIQILPEFGGNALESYSTSIEPSRKDSPRIVYKGLTTGHTGGEISSRLTKDYDNSPGHVFASVITHAFDNGNGPTITHGKTFSRTPRGE